MKSFLSKIFKKRAEPKQQPAAVAPLYKNTVKLTYEEGADNVVFKDLLLFGADGKPMIDYGSMTLGPGDRMIISGPAGCGKSAGLSALRNAWMLGASGEISAPFETRFVPQEEYFPDRTLRGIVCAPDPVTRFTTEQVEKALTEAGLGAFVAHMDDPDKRGEYWKNTLSGGQKNKLSFAGIFLHAEGLKLLIVDEVTAALDAKSESELYPKMLERMKHGVVISIAHHAALMLHHNVFAMVKDGKVTYQATAPAPAAKEPQEQQPQAAAPPPKAA